MRVSRAMGDCHSTQMMIVWVLHCNRYTLRLHVKYMSGKAPVHDLGDSKGVRSTVTLSFCSENESILIRAGLSLLIP